MDENMEWNNETEEELIKPTEESKMSWMMKKGWNIGKKVLITGATISSAPIVLPPLIIYSTIGVAFALPFGFVFGSYACTEKLMSKLLWRPDLEQQDQELALEEEEEEGYYGGDMMVMEEEERRFIEDTKGTLETRIEFVRDEIGEEPVKEYSEEVIQDARDNSYGDKFASATNETLEDQVLPPYYYTPAASSAILDNQSRIVNGSAVEKQRLSKTLGEEIAGSVVQPVSSEVEASMENKTLLPSEQVFYSEEEIWEQIGALRKIVGYQAAMQTTCVEELKALYVFTGVEPPFAFKDPADLEEINDKLRLLMLIVGVK